MPAEPTAKTVVAEMKVTAADIRVRTQMLKSASSIIVPADAPLSQVDVVVGPDYDHIIDKIDRFLYVVGYEDFVVMIRESSGAPDAILPQKGLFVSTGAIATGVVISALAPTRCSILYS